MVEAQQVKHRRMQVADLERIFYDFMPQLIGLAVGNSGLDPAAGHPNRERSWVMVPADPLHFLTVAILAHGRPAEFSATDNERVLEHASLFQISQQGRSRLIHFTAAVGEAEVQRFLWICPMGIPSPVIELNESHTALRKAPRHQTIVGKTGLARL